MSLESELHTIARKVEVQPPQAPVAPVSGQNIPAPSAEQVKAAEAVFSSGKQHADGVELLAFWSAGMVLHDLITEATTEPVDEDTPDKPAKDQPKR